MHVCFCVCMAILAACAAVQFHNGLIEELRCPCPSTWDHFACCCACKRMIRASESASGSVRRHQSPAAHWRVQDATVAVTIATSFVFHLPPPVALLIFGPAGRFPILLLLLLISFAWTVSEGGCGCGSLLFFPRKLALIRLNMVQVEFPSMKDRV